MSKSQTIIPKSDMQFSQLVRSVLFVIALLAGSVFALSGWGQETNQDRSPVPKEEDLKAAKKQIQEIFGTEIAAAKRTSEKSELATKLWTHARDSKDDVISQYALYESARSLAQEADDLELTFRLIDELATVFDVNELDLKTTALSAQIKELRSSKSQVDYCELIIDTTQAAAQEEQFETANKLVSLLAPATAKIKDVAQRKPLQTRQTILKHQQTQWAGVVKAKAALAQEPDDEAANLVYGRYLCLAAGDWDKGLPLLAKGGDTKLTKAAKQDLEERDSPESQLALADLWWSLGQAETGQDKQHLLLRSLEWYEACARELKGLTKTKADQRIEQIGKLYPEAAELQTFLNRRKGVELRGFTPDKGGTKTGSTGTGKSKSKPGNGIPVFGELDRELAPRLVTARYRVGIKPIGQITTTYLTKTSTLPEEVFGITTITSMSSTDFVASRQDLLKIPKLLNLETLYLKGAKLPTNFWSGFASVNTLSQLSLIDCGVTDATLAALPPFPQLRLLNVSGSNITGEGFKGAKPLTTTTHLVLNQTRIDDKGLAQVVRTFPNVTTLSLMECPISDAGLKSFQGLKSLQSVELGKTKITAKGLEVLASLSRLNTVAIPDTVRIDDAKTALPQCRNISVSP